MAMDLAHIKWFVDQPAPDPVSLGELLSPGFLVVLALATLAAGALAYLNKPLQRIDWVQGLHQWLHGFRDLSPLLVRLGLGGTLIIAAWGDFLLAMELGGAGSLLRWVQLGAGVLILWPAGVLLTSLVTIGLYFTAVSLFGWAHMLDYAVIPGAAVYLILLSMDEPWTKYALPALYASTGLSLVWLAVEKWVFPGMALDVILEYDIFTFGFAAATFIMLAGWVEFMVGYFLIVGILNRFLSLVVLFLFALTTMVFGAVEVAGHWLLHLVLLTFLIEGTGALPTPLQMEPARRGPLFFAAVGVPLLFFAVVVGYLALARQGFGV